MSVDLPESFDLYYYFRDGSGAITKLVKTRAATSTGVTYDFKIAAEYEYDPYGNPTSVDNSDGSGICYLNPLRYKDYIYDTETGWYYLQSRYYDPQIGRFINADAFVSTGQGIMDTNMFMYCNNNPINHHDVTGKICAKDSGLIGKYSYESMSAYKLINQTTIALDKNNNEITASIPIEGNPNIDALKIKSVAVKYSQKLHNKIDLLAKTIETNPTVMTEVHIYSELLAHYYGYYGLALLPSFISLNGKRDEWNNSLKSADLNPSESREIVLKTMQIIAWTYDE